jgi:hypothetical protein
MSNVATPSFCPIVRTSVIFSDSPSHSLSKRT